MFTTQRCKRVAIPASSKCPRDNPKDALNRPPRRTESAGEAHLGDPTSQFSSKHKTKVDLCFNEYIVKIHINKMQAQPSSIGAARQVTRWVDELEDEDVSFIKRLVLASGSLKELASVYGISYPTVRLRLDRLIEKVKLLDRQDVISPFERVLRMQHVEGKIDLQTLKLLLEAHQAEIRRGRNESERSPQ